MKRAAFWLIFLSLPYTALAQVSNEELRTMRILGDLERESRPYRSGSYLNGPEVEGDPYLWPRWSPGSITLYRDSKTFELPGLKYDVLSYGIDVLFATGSIKSLDGSLVLSFEYKDSLTQIPHKYVNGKDFKRDEVPIRGFLEVLCWGKIDVYALTTATLLKPNYNMAIGSGNPNYQIAKKRAVLYGPGVDLRTLSKKEVAKLWAEKKEAMAKFQRTNKLDLSSERGLLLMIDYFNTL